MPHFIKWGEERTELFPHARYDAFADTIHIPEGDEDIETHVALGHEIAHVKLGHAASDPFSLGIGEEVDAWNETIYNLMRGGEWTPRAKRSAIWALSSYFEGIEDDPKKEARGWIDRAEARAKMLLGRYSGVAGR